jgi:hypothetical protein
MLAIAGVIIVDVIQPNYMISLIGIKKNMISLIGIKKHDQLAF